ncbi:MFS general substrate transporter [Cristinia sonorae]|uniref:MFS general substrate transporter n=1 Tax=Cristinia sonorae TaxID=1940300 RepID=A0A8K0UWM8_9AGAR|nr:MFS general substrate transporter [Cristinia sonorae]
MSNGEENLNGRKEESYVIDEKNGSSISGIEAPGGNDLAQQFPTVNDKQLVRRIDLRLLPVLSLLYVLSFLDRVNIGNAAIFGLKADLRLTGDQFNTALLIFFIPFVVFEVPSNVFLKRLQPHVWLGGCILAFGLITLFQGFTKNYGGMLACRFFLGIFEAGVLPGCFYLMSMWYKRDEAQKRYTLLFSGCTFAGAFGGLLASAIGKMHHMRGLLGWRWVFILEGCLTCVASVFFYLCIPNFPNASKWLSQEEKDYIHAKLQADVGAVDPHESLTFKRALRIITDYKVILGGLQYFGLVVTAYSFVYFTPTIILTYGHDAITTQLLSVPPYACALLVAMAAAYISDRLAHRFLFALGSVLLAISGLVILAIVHDNTNLQYAALFMVASGSFTAQPIVLCWFSMNVRGHIERGIAIGWQIGFGGIGGIIASFSFLAKDAPQYRAGYRICIGFQCLTALTLTLYYVGVSIENRRLRNRPSEGEQVEAEDIDSVTPFKYYT